MINRTGRRAYMMQPDGGGGGYDPQEEAMANAYKQADLSPTPQQFGGAAPQPAPPNVTGNAAQSAATAALSSGAQAGLIGGGVALIQGIQAKNAQIEQNALDHLMNQRQQFMQGASNRATNVANTNSRVMQLIGNTFS